MSDNQQLAPLKSGPPDADYTRNYRLQSVKDLEVSEVDAFAYLRANWDILVKHRWLILSVASVLTVLVAIYSFKVTPVYQATARIEVEAELPLIQKLDDLFHNERSDETFLATQVSILGSDNLAWQTIQQLELGRLPEFGGTPQSRPGVVGVAQTTQAQLTKAFKQRCLVTQVKGTRMVEVSFESTDRDLAARATNALVNNYIEYNFRTKYDATRQATGWMEQQLDELKLKVEKSQQAMVDYERQNNLVDVGDKQGVASSGLEDLSKDLTQAQTDLLQKQSLYEMVKANEDQVGFVRQDLNLEHLQEKESDVKSAYVDALAKYGPNYPTVVRLREQDEDLKSLIKQERQRLLENVRNDYLAAQQHEKLLQDAVAQQKAEVGKLNQLLIQHNLLKREFETNQQLYENLLQHLKDATVSAGLRATNIHLVDQAMPPTYPLRPKKGRNIVFGLAAGLVLGIALAFAREAMDNSIKSAQELEMLISAPALAIIPSMSGIRVRSSLARRSGGQTQEGPGGSVELAVVKDPGSVVAESFRTLRTSILLSTAEHPPQALLVTSSQPSEGKTSTSLNLAFTLAQKGDRVILVDADLRRPGVARALTIPNDKGLSGILTGAYELQDAVLRVESVDNLWVLTAGPHPPNPAELLCSMKMERLFKQLRQQYDHIVVDSPPVLLITDATILSSIVDGVVMVVESEATTRAALARACRTIQHSGGKILGAVLNKVDARRDGYYGHYYYYGYYSYRGHDYYGNKGAESTS